MLLRKQLIKDSLNGLADAAHLVEERSVLHASYKVILILILILILNTTSTNTNS